MKDMRQQQQPAMHHQRLLLLLLTSSMSSSRTLRLVLVCCRLSWCKLFSLVVEVGIALRATVATGWNLATRRNQFPRQNYRVGMIWAPVKGGEGKRALGGVMDTRRTTRP